MKFSLEKNPVCFEKNPVFLEKNPVSIHILGIYHVISFWGCQMSLSLSLSQQGPPSNPKTSTCQEDVPHLISSAQLRTSGGLARRWCVSRSCYSYDPSDNSNLPWEEDAKPHRIQRLRPVHGRRRGTTSLLHDRGGSPRLADRPD